MSSQDPNAPKEVQTKHVKTGIDKNRLQLEKLMKNPSKPVVLPEPPKEKSIRPPREMVKNVQGSSAGAGSGEFHVYKAARRREYERLSIMEEQKKKEALAAESERKRKEREQEAEAKTAKNRAKRQKKKEARQKAKGKQKGSEKGGNKEETSESEDERPAEDEPFKKRRLIAPEPTNAANTEQDQGTEESVMNIVSDLGQATATAATATNVVIHDED